MSKITVSINLDQRLKDRKKDVFPVVLVVRVGGIPHRFPTSYSLSPQDYQKLSATRVSEILKPTKEKLKEIEASAEIFIKENQPFDLQIFTTNFVNQCKFLKKRKIKPTDNHKLPSDFDFTPYFKRFKILSEEHNDASKISFMFVKYIKKLITEERIGTALKIKDSYLSFYKFGGDMAYEKVDASFLTRYEMWMRKKMRSYATIGMYVRSMRTIFNEAIEARIISRESCYPFGKRRYVIPTGRQAKRHLQEGDLYSLLTHTPDTPEKQRALKYFIFLYHCNGCNPQDMAHLKYRNLVADDCLSFIRRKSERTSKRSLLPITAYVNEQMKNIIRDLGKPRVSDDEYIFPIMDETLNPLEQHELVFRFTAWLNEQMRLIGSDLGLAINPTSMVARHSLANRLKQVGAPTEYIQETLGHQSKVTTEIYLGSFPIKVKKEYSERIAFN